jgi:Peptidase family M23
MKAIGPLRALLPLAACALVAPAGSQDLPLVLAVPIDCRFGETCFIQNYLDHDPGPNAQDYSCGPMSYDGHDGVDLRLPSMVAQKQGVSVLAAAPGRVRGARDGMEDVSVAMAGPASVAGRECGNGVVIAHAGGWETQYCHMAKGSIRVAQGQEIAAGTPLGRVGLSGNTEFPHLHFSVRRDGANIDPFAADAAPGACGGTSLWSAEARGQLAYRSPELINSGFAVEEITGEDIESGRAGATLPGASSPNLIGFLRAIGLKAGDVQSLALYGPGGAVLGVNRVPALARDRAQQFLYTGKRRGAGDWPRGVYESVYEVRRQGAPVFVRRFSFTLR